MSADEPKTEVRSLKGKLSVDLNCDVGESFGAYQIGNDAEVLKYVSSASIACGFHAGDPATMRRTVKLAAERGVAIGAHPGLPDLVGFGRRAMELTPQQAYDLVVYQIGALQSFVTAQGAKLRHVKPHGALYTMAASDAALAKAIAEAVGRVDPGLLLMGQSGSELITAGRAAGLATANEVFADRTYQSDGAIMPRRHHAALITDPTAAAERAARMAGYGKVLSDKGTEVSVQADTICIHGDGPYAVEFAQAIRERLTSEGIEIRAIGDRKSIEDTR
jgi:5-oxoprolinase (ATP-hydrolysing) subunit A